MEQWLAGLIAAVPAPFRPAAQVVIGAILRVFQWVDGLFRRVVGGWNPIYEAARWLTSGITGFRDELVTTIRWLILTKIPGWANYALDLAVRWARDRIVELRDWTAGAVQAAIRWANDRINAVRDFAEAVRRWLVDLLRDPLEVLRQLRERVFGTWANPLRLAEWLIGALWTVFWRYAYSQRDRIVEWVWRSAGPLLLRFAAEIERQIARLL